MTATAATPARFDMGRVFRTGFGAMARRPVTLLLIGLLITAPSAAFSDWATLHLFGPRPPASNLAATFMRAGLLQLLAIAVSGVGWIRQGAVAYCIGSDVAERRLDVGELLGRLMSQAPTLYVLGIVTTLATVLGSFLLILPGIIISLAWSMGPAVVMLERRPFLSVLGRSAEITRNHRMSLFGLAVIVGLASAVLSFGLRAVSGLALVPNTRVGDPALYDYVLRPALSAVVGVVSAALTTAPTWSCERSRKASPWMVSPSCSTEPVAA
jgi:hypothetical protein